LFAKINFLRSKPKGNQNNTKPKHGMDAVWLGCNLGMATTHFLKNFVALNSGSSANNCLRFTNIQNAEVVSNSAATTCH